MFKPRPAQEDILSYGGGKMGVSAVPGSGKTQTLSYLAANLIANQALRNDQEVLIVTLVNSAVDNFSTRIESFVRAQGLLPGLGYRVRTLHGLAHDIVRQRPDLVGLSDRFQIVDERGAEEILRDATISWLRGNPDFIGTFGNPDIDPYNPKLQKDWTELALNLTGSFIRSAKDKQATPAEIRKRLDNLGIKFPLLEMGCQVYADYQRALNYRNAVDFDDLIRLALDALMTDPSFLHRLQYQWPYILEDEAQDSSRLQEEILRLLARENGNWVRVGDPNQAIFETFTTASPEYLRHFLKEPGVVARALPNSGRSTWSIIRLANYLIEWSQEHPNPDLKGTLSLPQIEMTGRNDPQPNPPDQPDAIHLVEKKYSPDQELQVIIRSLKMWLADHPDRTVAVLVPRNERGAKVVEELKKNEMDYVELLRSSLSTRQVAEILAAALRALADPGSSHKLMILYRLLSAKRTEPENHQDHKSAVIELLKNCVRVEDFLWPRLERDWLTDLARTGQPDSIIDELQEIRNFMRNWQAATLLPIDQLLLTISQEIFDNPADLAMAHKLALMLESTSESHPEWGLFEFSQELESIALNRRKLLGFSEDDSGFDPDQYKGKVCVATIHKSKGLEWDRVYLLSVNNYDFPSAMEYDSFIAEKWFIQGRLNLQAETLAKLDALLSGDQVGMYTEEGQATHQARLEYAAERLRLLFVGITRARKELIITWNTGKTSALHGESHPALPFVALESFWKGIKHGHTA